MLHKGDTFNIGQVCPESGIYRLTQCTCKEKGGCEVSEEQYTIPLTKGEKFPPCRSCGNGGDIKWEFVRRA